MVNVGILSYQGSVEEHNRLLSLLEGVKTSLVRTRTELENVDALIIPGGESTTIGKLLKIFDMIEPIRDKIKSDMPVWGTCAGMILLAKKIIGESDAHLKIMDIEVKRNAYGSQLDSFAENAVIKDVSDKAVPLVFIRAPWVESMGKNVNVLAKINEKIVAVREGNMLATSFHPELTDDLSFHKYFVNMIKKA